MAFSQEAADIICERLAQGESLRAICNDADLPSRTEVFRWLAEEANANFRDQYARAREAQADAMFEDILEIADDECTMVRSAKHPNAKADDDGDVEVVFDATAVARNRLRVDARKWALSKMLPKKYGDKLELAGDASNPLKTSLEVTFK